MLALISSFPPLSTDLYLPALPGMIVFFGETPARVNLTLSLFFIFFAVGILLWGPLSEKYGRKPILSVGLVIYILASIFCALAGNITQLIIFRIFQAIGGGAATAVSTAIVKDTYSGKQRETVLAVVMTMVIIAPVVAPLMGGVLLKIASWRAVFWLLAGIGTIALAASLLFQESLERKYTGSILHSLGRLAVVLKNPGFSFLLIIFSLAAIPMMAYIAASSYIYIQGFGLGEQAFGCYFSLNALWAMAGPICYIRISKFFSPGGIISICFVLLAASGMATLFIGSLSPVLFALCMGPATLSILAMKPPSANLLLEQQEDDTGSASSLISCLGMMMGSLGMFMVSTPPTSLISTLGGIQLGIGLAGGILWWLVRDKPFVKVPQGG